MSSMLVLAMAIGYGRKLFEGFQQAKFELISAVGQSLSQSNPDHAA